MTNGYSHYTMLELQPHQMITFLSLQIPENDPRLPADATRIFYTNAEVDAYKEKLRNISGKMFVSKSFISSPLGCHSKLLNGRVDDTAFAESVCLKVGCRVVLVYNVDVKDGLTNGQLGVIAEIITSDASLIYCLLVNLDDENVGSSLRKQYPQFHRMYPGAVPISKCFGSYQLRGKKQHGARSHLLQLPLRLARASTCHEVQGQTFPGGHKVVIKWDGWLQSGMAYVMLSRSRNPNDISITGQFNPRQIRRNAEAKLMRDFLQLPERSPTSTANILVIVLSRHSIIECKSGRFTSRPPCFIG